MKAASPRIYLSDVLLLQNGLGLHSSLTSTKAHTSAMSNPLATVILQPPPRAWRLICATAGWCTLPPRRRVPAVKTRCILSSVNAFFNLAHIYCPGCSLCISRCAQSVRQRAHRLVLCLSSAASCESGLIRHTTAFARTASFVARTAGFLRRRGRTSGQCRRALRVSDHLKRASHPAVGLFPVQQYISQTVRQGDRAVPEGS